MERIEDNIIYKYLEQKNSIFIQNINEMTEYIEGYLPQMISIFGNYTVHTLSHAIHVLDNMSQLIVEIDKLSDLELTMIIYAALLHDVGMVVTQEEVNALSNESNNDLGMKYGAVLQSNNNYREKALQEYFRPVHGIRSARHIKNMEAYLFCIPKTAVSFCDEIASICQSHNESYYWILNNLSTTIEKGKFSFNAQYIALLLRLGDILDIDERRAPSFIHDILTLDEQGSQEWKQNFVIENSKKIFPVLGEKNKIVRIFGKSEDPNVHRKVLRYIDQINQEIKFAVYSSKKFAEEKYNILLQESVENNVTTKGFTFSDFRLSLDYNAVTNLLMGEKIYGNKKAGLREILQNSIDACKVMKEINESSYATNSNEYRATISIIIDKEKSKVKIRDNGVGMTLDTLKHYFLNIGVSYYSSNEFMYKGYRYNPIGKYGIGFLACFMLSDKVIVTTKHYMDLKSHKIEIQKNSEYICLTETTDFFQNGTEVEFDYNSFMQIFDNSEDVIIKYVEENFLIDDISIQLVDIIEGKRKPKNISNLKTDTVILNQYFEDIEVRLDLKYKNSQIIGFEDIIHRSSNDIYIYDEINNCLISKDELEEQLNLNHYVNNDTIRYLKVSVVDEMLALKIRRLEDVTNDFEEAYERCEDEIDKNVYIFAKDFENHIFNYGFIVINDYIIGKYSYLDFCSQFGAFVGGFARVDNEEKIVSHKSNLKSVMIINKEKSYGYKGFFWNVEDCNFKIYNKNVFLSRMNITIPYLAEAITIETGIVNLMRKDVFPNLARDSVEEKEILVKLSEAIGRAVHLYIYDNLLNEESDEKDLLNRLIEKYYPEKNPFLSEEGNRKVI